MGAVGGVAILGGNFEASTFPEDKVVQRSLTAGTQESSPIDAIILDALPLGAPGQLDSHATVWKGHSNDGSPHTIDWKLFVDVTADDGTGSLWTLQTRIDAAPYGTVMTIDDNGLLTVSGATFTMDQLIIDADNTEAVLIRKDGDAGDVFIVDTVNDVVRLASNDTFLTFGASSDARLERFGPRDIGMREPGVGGVSLGAGGENTFRLYARDDVAGSAARFLELTGDGPLCLVKANRAAGGGQFDLFLDVSVGKIGFFNEGVQRWNIQGSVTADFEFAPFITNRYDLGSAALAVRNLYTNGVLIGQDKTSAYDAIIIDATALVGDGQQDSGAIIWTGKGFETATPHDIDWKAFVNVTADDGTGSIWTLQARIDGASFVDEFTITATTSPTLVHIGPGSTDGALAFGPIGADGPAQAGTIRFRFTDDIRFRNEDDNADAIALSFGESAKMIFGESNVPVIEFATFVNVLDNLRVDNASSSAFIVATPTTNFVRIDTNDFEMEVGVSVDRSASVVERLLLNGSDLSVNSTVGFSPALFLEGQARTAGGVNHDAKWRMYVEPLTTTAFDGQSVFKITAEIDTGGPTTVFTLSDTGDLIVPGSFTIDGLIIDVDSTEAFLVRMNGDGGDVFNVDTDGSLVQLRGGAALEIGSIPASAGSIRLSNTDSIIARNLSDDGDLNIFDFGDSNEADFGDADMPIIRILASRLESNRLRISQTSQTALEVNNVGNTQVLVVDTTTTFSNPLVRVIGGSSLTIGTLTALSGSIRIANADDIVWRNAGNDDDIPVFSFASSNIFDIGDVGDATALAQIRLHSPEVSIPAGRFEIRGSSASAFRVLDGSSVLKFNVDTTNSLVKVVGSAALTIGSTPALSGSIRLSYLDSITFRNTADDGDLSIIAFDDSNQMLFGEAGIPRMDINAGRLITNRIRITHTQAAAFEVNNDSNLILFRVDTSAGDVFLGQNFLPSRLVLTQADLTGAGFEDSPSVVYEGKSHDGTPHTQQFITFVDMETNAGAGQWTLRSRFDGGGNVNLVFVTDEGRFAIAQPEQVSIGSQSFIDNVQVNITGNFIDDYGGGPTTTHKVKIGGGQTGDSGRTIRQTTFDLSNAFITTQNNSETVDEVGGMFINPPSITPGTDTITKAYTLKVMNTPTLAGTENYGLFVDSASAATNLTALVRIGRSFNQGIKLLVGGGVGAENIEGTAQMRLTNFYTPDGLQTEAMLLHVHSTLQATDGTTDHITGAFFEGTLRTQVEADENVANISQVRIDEPNIQDNLTGTGEITIAQSLLITGAPTEGVRNYALRIQSGDVHMANSAALIFRNDSDDTDIPVLSFDDSNVLLFGNTTIPVIEINSRLDVNDQLLVRHSSDVTTAFNVRRFSTGETMILVDTSTPLVQFTSNVTEFRGLTAVVGSATTSIIQARAEADASSGSSITLAGLIPAGAFVLGVTTRIRTNVSGPAGFTVGDGIDADRWGTSNGLGSGAVTDGTDFTSGNLTLFSAANDVVITSDGVDFTGGTIAVAVHYMFLEAPIN